MGWVSKHVRNVVAYIYVCISKMRKNLITFRKIFALNVIVLNI